MPWPLSRFHFERFYPFLLLVTCALLFTYMITCIHNRDSAHVLVHIAGLEARFSLAKATATVWQDRSCRAENAQRLRDTR